jgi:hypothetical protein
MSTGVPVNVAGSGTAAQSTVNGSFTANLGINGNYGDFTHTLGTDGMPFWQVTLTNEMAIFSVVLFNRTSCCGSRLRDITIEIISTNAGVRVTNYTSSLLNPENALASPIPTVPPISATTSSRSPAARSAGGSCSCAAPRTRTVPGA